MVVEKKIFNIFSLLRFHLPPPDRKRGSSNKLELLIVKNVYCYIWLKFVHWVRRRSVQMDGQTGRQTDRVTTDQIWVKKLIYKDFSSGELNTLKIETYR